MREALLEADWGVRHYWLVWARPEEILAERDCFEDWVLVGALRAAPPELLALGRHASPERRALTLQRRRARGVGRHSQADCVRGIRDALHPQLRLAWMLLLIEGFPQAAGLEFIRLLSPARDSELRSACALGLALLGRPALVDLREFFDQGPASAKEFYCQALWHLGPEARGCQSWLESYDSNWSRAVFYRLEADGWRVLLQRRVWPLWIDRESLAALAEMAFSLEAADQLYALRALLGWGPEFERVETLLKALARDPNRELSESAIMVAEYSGWSGSAPPARDDLAARLQITQSAPASPLSSLTRQRELLDAFAYLEANEQLEYLQELAAHGIPDPKSAEQIWHILEFPYTTPWRLAALNAYLRVGRRPRRLADLLSDFNPKMREAAAEVVVQESCPEYLLANLDRVEVQRALSQGPHLLRALMEWPPEQFDQLEERLRELGLDSALALLEPSVVRWSRFAQFTPLQHQAAAALVRRHKGLPAELVEEVSAGRLWAPGLLEFWETYPPALHRCPGLAQLLIRVTDSERPPFRNALRQQGESGALALAELLKDSDPGIAEKAARELIDWPEARPWAQSAWLEGCPHPSVVDLVTNWIQGD